MKVKEVLKILECSEDNHAAAADYIRRATKEVWRQSKKWLTPLQAKLEVAPHRLGLCVYLIADQEVPIETVNEIRMMMHNRHRPSKETRKANIKGKRDRKQKRKCLY